jgi:hypothetical protein
VRRVNSLRGFIAELAVLLTVVLAGLFLWLFHAKAWDLGRSTPILDDESAQVAVAARELADHGRLETTFAYPLELSRTAKPPWPLALVQPGLVLTEAAFFRAVPRVIHIGDILTFNLQVPQQREWLTLLVPFFCYLALGALLTLVASRLLGYYAPQVPALERGIAALTVGLAFLLDTEAQHLASRALPDLAFALGLTCAFASLAVGRTPARRPLLFGLMVGVTVAFHTAMVWLVPVLALAATALAPERRGRVLALTLAGSVLPLIPWWLYQWRTFGAPASDLARLMLWDGIQSRSWFSLIHLPDPPALPHGGEAVRLIAGKVARRLPELILALATGPRALWAGAVVLWAWLARPPRTLAVTAWTIVIAAGLGAIAAAAAVPTDPPLFPTRVPLEAAGMLALWGLIAAAPGTLVGVRLSRLLKVGVAVVALGWGARQTLRGNTEAVAGAEARTVTNVLTIRDLAFQLRQRVPMDEVVMSNAGARLAWYTRRPFIHLTLSPADLGACRSRLEFRHVLLILRNVDQAWPAWREVAERPEEATKHPEWNIIGERHWNGLDGSLVVWLELGPAERRLAAVE